MTYARLKNAPLKEAVFELFWDSPLDKTGFPVDQEFDLSQGIFAKEISSIFPLHKRIMPFNIPPSIKIYGNPVHQFWKSELGWPVVQFGPGVLTVNDTDKNYSWDDNFRQNIITAIEILFKSYKEKLIFKRVSLRYIDSVELQSKLDSGVTFLKENFKSEIINKFDPPGETVGFNINQVFKVLNDSQVHLNIQTATNNINGKPALVWITLIEKLNKSNKEEILQWIDEAHKICSDLFIQTLNEEFYESFNK